MTPLTLRFSRKLEVHASRSEIIFQRLGKNAVRERIS
jgi:hypothetical protein